MHLLEDVIVRVLKQLGVFVPSFGLVDVAWKLDFDEGGWSVCLVMDHHQELFGVRVFADWAAQHGLVATANTLLEVSSAYASLS